LALTCRHLRAEARGALNHEGPTPGTALTTGSKTFTSQLAEQATLNGPSLEKATEGYSATLRSSTRSTAKSFQPQNVYSERPTCFDDVRGQFPRLDIEVLGAQRDKPNA
jgi:hypothetical protein